MILEWLGSWQEEEGFSQNRGECVWREAVRSDKGDFKMKLRKRSREMCSDKRLPLALFHLPLQLHALPSSSLPCALESNLPCSAFVLNQWNQQYRNSLCIQVTTSSTCPSVLGLVMAPGGCHTLGAALPCLSFPKSYSPLCN